MLITNQHLGPHTANPVLRRRIWVLFSLCAIAAATGACRKQQPDPSPGSGESTTTSPGAPPATTSPTPDPAPTTTTPEPPFCNAKSSRKDKKRDLSRREVKIVGGEESKEEDWKFMVALATGTVENPRQYCGGSLIKDRWVLTAAHCQVLPGELVITGRHDLGSKDGKVIEVKSVFNHGGYDSDTNDNDIAVLELAEAVTLPPVELQEGSAGLVGDSVVIGWGHLKEAGPASPVLQEVVVPLVTNSVCSAGYSPDNISITGNMLCAGLAEGGKDSCQGDSGGPLLVKGSSGEWRQAGIVSFGVGCARPNRYGVYSRVSQYTEWVKACTKS